MKISAINVGHSYAMKSNQNFKGILKFKNNSYDEWDYHGEPSGSSYNGHYVGDRTDDYYTYYPFLGESEEKIQKALRDNNYSNDCDGGGILSCYSRSTERGKTLPFTEREWNRMSKREKERIEALLD